MGKRFAERLADKNIRTTTDYKFLKSFLYAKKGEFAKVDSIDRNALYDLWVNRNKISKGVLDALADGVKKHNEQNFKTYDFLRTSYFFDVYRTNADFKRILARAKQNQDDNLLKYEKFDVTK